ncbi:uncharacterized protein LOC144932963 [Lampetra fluviatilis]
MAEKMDKADRSLTERLMGRLHPPRLSRNLSLRRENSAAAASRGPKTTAGGAAGGAHTIARIPHAGGDQRRPHTACELERLEEREEQRAAAAGIATGRAVSACDVALAGGTPLAEEGGTPLAEEGGTVTTSGEAGRRPSPPLPPENKLCSRLSLLQTEARISLRYLTMAAERAAREQVCGAAGRVLESVSNMLVCEGMPSNSVQEAAVCSALARLLHWADQHALTSRAFTSVDTALQQLATDLNAATQELIDWLATESGRRIGRSNDDITAPPKPPRPPGLTFLNTYSPPMLPAKSWRTPGGSVRNGENRETFLGDVTPLPTPSELMAFDLLSISAVNSGHGTGSDVIGEASPPPLPEKKAHVQTYIQMCRDYKTPDATSFIAMRPIDYRLMPDIQDIQATVGDARAAPPPVHERAPHAGAPHAPSSPGERNDSPSGSHADGRPGPSAASGEATSAAGAGPVSPSGGLGGGDRLPGDLPVVVIVDETPVVPAGDGQGEAVEEAPGVDAAPSATSKSPAGDGVPTMGGASPSVATPCSEQEELFLVDYQEIIRRLVLRSQVDSGPDLKGGSQDILIVHATMADKKQYLVFCEAFIVTYRTFISSEGLLRKLIMRYRHLSRTEDAAHTRARRNALSLLLRVTDDLCVSELTDEVVCLLAGVVCACVTGGDLPLARPLRDTLVTRVMARRAHAQATSGTPLASLAVSARPASVHDFRSLELAEQLTLLDSELLQKIEIPEVLLWAKDQNDEKSPNLTRFTEHFNAVSYWAQTVLIQADKQSERERLAHKFLKIMKHLRRLNNYNSYLALLSALEASAIARLTWPKSVTETMAEFRQLIDSSGSFSNYRSALEKAQPPCLPYLGLILQDLTFVHMGNPDLIAGRVNFSKRWQQFNILQSLRTFLHCRYEFQRVDSVLSCFDGFTARLGEESLYELSLAIKPRAQRRHCDQLTA